jgi:hypothetical protein
MSTLLEQASLVMIPSGYKEDVVYSQIPTNGSGDLSFTRASNGTRINSAGLVEVTPWNLLQQSETFDNAYWNLYQATITSNTTTAPNGTTTADTLSSSSGFSGVVYTSAIFSAGDILTLSIYAKANTSSILQLGTTDGTDRSANFNLSTGVVVSSVGVTASIESVGNGWYRCSVSRTMLNPANFFVVEGTGSLSLFIWGAQTNVGVSAKPYFPTTDRLNVPRLTYQNGGGGCPSLLLEKQSTNVITYSEQFDNASWTKGGSNSVTANAIISPDGTQNADFLVSTATNTAAKYAYQVITSTATPTATIYAKAGAITEMMFYCQGGNGIYFNLTNGAFIAYYGSGSSTITSYSSVAVGNGWYRYSLTFNTSVTSIEVYMSVSANISPNIANGDGFYIWGAQLEASSYPTSYIPTTSASATRVADACFKTGISSLIGQTEGTLFFQIERKSGDYAEPMWLSDGSYSNYIYFVVDNTQVRFIGVNSSGGQWNINTTALSQGVHKIAGAYKANDIIFYIDGVQIGTDTNAQIPTCSFLGLGYENTVAYNNGDPYSQVAIFPTRLTNAELASLTTI